MMQENEQLRKEYEKKCRAVEELRELHTQVRSSLRAKATGLTSS